MASLRRRKRRDGTWAFNVLYKLHGQQTSATFDTEREAEEFRDMVNAVGAERAMKAWDFSPTTRVLKKASGTTVGEWLDHYINHRTGITKAALYDYRSYLRNDINPLIGPIPLTVLSRDDVEAWMQALTEKQKRGKLPAGKTLANKHGLLSAALNAAVRAGKIPSNVALGTRIPRTERPDMVFLSKEDFAKLLTETPAHWQPMLEFLVASGARFGEVSALKPGDVDRAAGTVRIVRAWKRTYTKGGYELGPTKTKKSTRTINVPKTVLDKLDYEGEWLFTNSGRGASNRGGPVRVSNFRTNVWWPATAKAKLNPRPRIHDLRHTCASWLIQAGIPLPVIQQHMGHESIEVTVGVYGHLDRSSAQAAATAIGDMLS